MKRPDIEHEGIITGISKSHIFVRMHTTLGLRRLSCGFIVHDNRPKRKNHRG